MGCKCSRKAHPTPVSPQDSVLSTSSLSQSKMCEPDPNYVGCICRKCKAAIFTNNSEDGQRVDLWDMFNYAFEKNRVRTELDLLHEEPREDVNCSNCNATVGYLYVGGTSPEGKRFEYRSKGLMFFDKGSLKPFARPSSLL